ncbi:MAG TPA: hypothetical protein VFU37_02385, partial [Pyrinomonadaceae bacterium]|nr:hypothetical protein [Pyrinomonadaceae bacterium]
MANDHRNTVVAGNSLRSALRKKSWRRREELARLPTGSPASHPIRNDLVPRLELIERAPVELKFPAR